MVTTASVRDGFDYVFVMRETIEQCRRAIFRLFCEHALPMHFNFEAFCAMLDQCTRDYECLVIDRTATEPSAPSDVFFFYRASVAG
jgi:hypothetical protein